MTLRETFGCEDERRMRHHHYHCEHNPDGFRKLKLENYQREGKESIGKEAELLKSKRLNKK